MLSWTPASMMFGHHVDSALSIVKKTASDVEVFRVRWFSELHLVNLLASGWNRAPISSLLRSLQTGTKLSAYAEIEH